MPQRSARLVTADELARLPDDNHRYELVEGRIVRRTPTGGLHGAVAARLIRLLSQHAEALQLGVVVTEVGFTLARNPDTVRAPDIAFVRRERVPDSGVPRGFWPGPPDLAVEILSPDDRPPEIETKVAEYLKRGVRLVWAVDPDARSITAHHHQVGPTTMGLEDALGGEDVLPGFRCPLSLIFRENPAPGRDG